MYQLTILLFAIVSFVTGYATSSFRTMMLIYTAGVVIAFVIAVPDWPYFNLHPQRWLEVDEDHPKWGEDADGAGAGAGAAAGQAAAAGAAVVASPVKAGKRKGQ
jgi:signal peptidase complex subunit 1